MKDILIRLNTLGSAETLQVKRSELRSICNDAHSEISRLRGNLVKSEAQLQTRIALVPPPPEYKIRWEDGIIMKDHIHIRMERKELQLMWLFATAPRGRVTHDDIENREIMTHDSVRVYISRFRSKCPWTIDPVRGVGYQMMDYTGGPPTIPFPA